MANPTDTDIRPILSDLEAVELSRNFMRSGADEDADALTAYAEAKGYTIEDMQALGAQMQRHWAETGGGQIISYEGTVPGPKGSVADAGEDLGIERSPTRISEGHSNIRPSLDRYDSRRTLPSHKSGPYGLTYDN